LSHSITKHTLQQFPPFIFTTITLISHRQLNPYPSIHRINFPLDNHPIASVPTRPLLVISARSSRPACTIFAAANIYRINLPSYNQLRSSSGTTNPDFHLSLPQSPFSRRFACSLYPVSLVSNTAEWTGTTIYGLDDQGMPLLLLCLKTLWLTPILLTEHLNRPLRKMAITTTHTTHLVASPTSVLAL